MARSSARRSSRCAASELPPASSPTTRQTQQTLQARAVTSTPPSLTPDPGHCRGTRSPIAWRECKPWRRCSSRSPQCREGARCSRRPPRALLAPSPRPPRPPRTLSAPFPHPLHALAAPSLFPLRAPSAPSAHPLRTLCTLLSAPLPAPAPNLRRRCRSSRLAARAARRRCWDLLQAVTPAATGRGARARTQTT